MGLILDTSILIAGERGGKDLSQVLAGVRVNQGEEVLALSAVSVAELTHAIYRTSDPRLRSRRNAYVQRVLDELPIYPLTAEIARLVGQVEGEQAALGNVIAFEDLTIGATALHLNYGVLTLNTRHFTRIPGLTVLTP